MRKESQCQQKIGGHVHSTSLLCHWNDGKILVISNNKSTAILIHSPIHRIDIETSSPSTHDPNLWDGNTQLLIKDDIRAVSAFYVAITRKTNTNGRSIFRYRWCYHWEKEEVTGRCYTGKFFCCMFCNIICIAHLFFFFTNSTLRHGVSINTFYSRLKDSGPTLIVIEDSMHHVCYFNLCLRLSLCCSLVLFYHLDIWRIL